MLCWCSGTSEGYDDDTQELFGLGPSVIEDKPFCVDFNLPAPHEHDISHHDSDGLFGKCNSASDNLLDELFS